MFLFCFRKELSTDQVDKPVNTGALTNWVEHIPEDVRADIDTIAPMLQTLGYNSHAYPPNYGTPDKQVAENSKDLKKNIIPPLIKGGNKKPVIL